ncbi:MAG: hybrid sensor histidine kinase/response regulator [Candidatus Dormibacteria bacterium]
MAGPPVAHPQAEDAASFLESILEAPEYSVIARDLRSQLAEREAYNRSLIEASADALFAIAPDGIITDVNQEATRLTGFSRRHLINSRFAEYFTTPDLAGAGVNQTLSEGRVIGCELTLVTRDGLPVEVSFNAGVVRDAAGQPRGILACARDITEQKGLIEQLRSSQFYTRSLIESDIAALITTDPIGVITDVNEQMCLLTGAGRDALIGSEFATYFTDPAAAAECIKQTLREGNVTHYELTVCGARDRDQRVVSYNAATFNNQDGTLRGVFAAARDVTEIKRVERELGEARISQTQRLESLGQLAGGIAHDFNNTLGVIMNYAAFVADALPANSEIADDIDEIRRAAERAAALTHQLLVFGRREVVNPQVLDLNQVVSDLDNMLRRTLGENVELRLDLGNALPPVHLDPTQVEQVLVNLAVNARDAAPTGGILSITTREINFEAPFEGDSIQIPAGHYALLMVADNGEGMDATTARRAFEPFYTTKPKGKGTGLGLATVYGIVRQAQGHLDLETNVGRGTVFRIYIPATTVRPSQAPSTRDDAVVEDGGETILLVEDEDAVREFTRRILSRRGFVVVPAASTAEAIETLAAGPGRFDLILTDVIMPGMDGPAMVDIMRTHRPDLRVVYMSGYPEDVIAHQGVGEAGVRLMSKPFTERDLMREVRGALDAPAQSATLA